MNVRRIMMVMLVLGCLVQGVSALDSIFVESRIDGIYSGGVSDSENYVYPPEYYLQTGTAIWYMWHYNNRTACDGRNSAVLVRANTPLNSAIGGGDCGANQNLTYSGTTDITVPNTGLGVVYTSSHYDYGASSYTYEVLAYGSVLVTFDPVHNATGESCTGTGIFDVYTNNTHTYTDDADGNYSFTIAEGVEYQIYDVEGSQWHNFTATASDHTWNPPCTRPSISGTITALDGEGIYNLNVTLHDFYLYERDLVDSTFTDSTGSYNFYINDSDDAGPYALSVSGYCNAGADCSTFRIEAPINPGGESYVFDYTWHIPSSHRVKLEYENGTGFPSALLHFHNLPTNSGTWRPTAADGYTTFISMQTSKIYVDYHGGDNGVAAGSTALHSFTLTPNGQYRRSQYVLTLPTDFTNNTTIPPAPPVVDEANLTDITQMDADGMFLVSVRDSNSSAPLENALVTAMAQDRNYTGQHTGYTNASGQYSFSRNHTVGRYDVTVGLDCYMTVTKSRSISATFDLVYSCGPPPGTDENGTGNWQAGSSNWTYNGTLEDENDTKNKFNSLMYVVITLGALFLLATYFKKK